MYVKATKRTLRDGGESIHLALVRSYRTGGKMRHEHIGYLGAYQPDKLTEWDRLVFWHTASERLDGLGLPPAERGKIEAALAQRVPRP